MRSIVADKDLIAYCGLYCGACGKYLSGKCPGCAKNKKADWCKTRSCCMERGYGSCADCATTSDPAECKKVNNPISKLFGLIFRSDRLASLRCIKERGYEAYAKEMAEQRIMSIKK